MAEAERLNQLRRQRALIADHLAWLDKEIAMAGAGQNTGEAPPPTPAPLQGVMPPVKVATTSSPRPAPPAAAALPLVSLPAPAPADDEADTLLKKFAENDDSLNSQFSKSGCWVIFVAILLVVLGGTVAAIYFKYR